jgi:hypothetical protein
VEHRYKVHWFDSNTIMAGSENFTEVQFADHSGLGLEVPEPRFVAMHAAIAHVLHLSGAGEVFDNLMANSSVQMPCKHQ